ncbi:MAG: site-specific DNA-methyltransferase [candidate division Zixibacteria bacterium]|nr:site-specific DNA-methyltransferase [candidate division Zixibacteria bacterium]
MTIPLFPKPPIEAEFSDNAQIVLHSGDTLKFAETLPDETFRLIITSPPYNLGKDYEKKTSIKEYLVRQEVVINELIRVLKRNGSLCWQVENFVLKSEVFPLDVFYYGIFKKKGLKLRNRIIWHFNHGLHASKRFSGRYETLLWFTKSDNYVFNLDDVRIPAKYPGKTFYKGPNRGKPSGNPLGKNPSDFWEFMSEEWNSGVWEIPNVKANHPEKTIHPCQFPIELVERCVLALTNKNDWVLDPYCGVGSSLIAALKTDRKAVGVDKEESYISLARQRIDSFYAGNLKIRPIGKPVYRPTGREKVSQVPIEWGAKATKEDKRK